jgi:hypothetical protein
LSEKERLDGHAGRLLPFSVTAFMVYFVANRVLWIYVCLSQSIYEPLYLRARTPLFGLNLMDLFTGINGLFALFLVAEFVIYLRSRIPKKSVPLVSILSASILLFLLQYNIQQSRGVFSEDERQSILEGRGTKDHRIRGKEAEVVFEKGMGLKKDGKYGQAAEEFARLIPPDLDHPPHHELREGEMLLRVKTCIEVAKCLEMENKGEAAYQYLSKGMYVYWVHIRDKKKNENLRAALADGIVRLRKELGK